MTRKPYRPSNSTEGEAFMSRMCRDCACDSYGKDEEPELRMCDILANAMAGIQPDEWIEDERGARCTAFRLDDDAPAFDPQAAIGLLL